MNRSWQIGICAGTILLATLVGAATAQDRPTARDTLAAAVRSAITQDALTRHARAIVAHERPSGSPGENAAIDYILETLRNAGVPVEVHTFLAYASDPVAAAVEVVGELRRMDAITMAFSGSARNLEAPLVDVGRLRDLPQLEVGTGERLVLPSSPGRLTPDLTGAIALVEGQPRNVPTSVLAQLGAVGIIFVNPEERLNDLIVTSTWGVPSLRNFHRLPTIPVAQVKKSDGERLRTRLARGPVRVRLTTEVSSGWKPLRLAVARIPGPDPRAPLVVLGGHIDGWYHGATDEGASNAAMIELAIAFHRHREGLRRGLVVAWWPGHSNARYAGSTWFADRFDESLRTRGIAYLNIDGVGQRGAKRFGASTTSSMAALASHILRQRTGAQVVPGRPGRNSDQSFNGIGLALLQFHHTRLPEDGGYWWWHTPDDTFDKIDVEILETDTDLYVDALAALLVEPVVPLDIAAEVEALGQEMERRALQANGRFDLSAAHRKQERLLILAREIQSILERESKDDGGIDLALMGILRPLLRVLYSPSDPFHPDPGIDLGLLPGMAPVTMLATEPFESDRYGFAETTLVRERNRLLDALTRATGEAERLLAQLRER